MSCETPPACVPRPPGLGLAPPPPGQRPLRRRVGDFDAFVRDLIADVERRLVDGAPLGRAWDVEGDPAAARLVELWAYVAEIVAAYTELTAAEAYLGTASDWTDLRRLGQLVGYRPRPSVAAQGWVRFEVDRGVDPLVPAGTRVQAPGTPDRAAQTFEVARDTQLRTDWDRLTATWVPVARKVEGRTVRFLGDPGFGAGDLVLFVREQLTPAACVPPDFGSFFWSASFWTQYWRWLLCLWGITPKAEPLVVAGVVSQASELGTTLVEFDRDLGGVLEDESAAYAGYRVLASAGQARRLSKVVTITGTTVQTPSVEGKYTGGGPVTETSVVLDVALEDLSAGQTVAVVAWGLGEQGKLGSCDVVEVKTHRPITWEVAPGTPTRASRLGFAETVPTLAAVLNAPAADPTVTVYVLDRRVVARHYEFPEEPEGATQSQLRLYPAPAVAPERVAVRTAAGDRLEWEVLECREADAQETAQPGEPGDAPRGLIVDLVAGPPAGRLSEAPASANLARVRHGKTASTVLGSGDATRARQRFAIPDAPIAYDLDPAGSVVPSQDLRVDGVRWDEVSSLYGQGPAEVFDVRLEADGGVTVRFGDGEQGARPSTGRRNVTSTYRVGGGTAGEVRSGAIDSLLGSVRGVRKAEGAGPTAGGADQDDERRMRTLVPARARAFGRAISIGDLVDLSLGYPGVTHAAAWHGTGPPGCACGGVGLHLAFVRAATAGPRAPEAGEIAALASFLDARRDATVALCVCGGVPSDPKVVLEVRLAVDPRRLVADVVAAARVALADPAGPLAPPNRALGQPLDRSDVFAILHSVTGVVGVVELVLPGAAGELGRRPAARYELIVLDPEPDVGGEPA